MPIRNRLAEIIKSSNGKITQASIVKKLNSMGKEVTRATISNIVREIHTPSMELSYLIAEALDMEVTDIFYYEKD